MHTHSNSSSSSAAEPRVDFVLELARRNLRQALRLVLGRLPLRDLWAARRVSGPWAMAAGREVVDRMGREDRHVDDIVSGVM